MEEAIVIISGGLATRLGPLAENIPKSLLEFNNKPFIQHQIELLAKKGFKNIVICLGHLGEQIEDFLGNGKWLNVDINYSFDGATLLGTGGAVLKARNYLSDVFFIIYGDSYLDIDYKTALNFLYENNKLGLMTVYENNNQYDKSNVIYKNNMVALYDKKNRTNEMDYIDYGLSIFNKEALNLIDLKSGFYDLADLLNILSKKNQLLGFEVKKRFYEIGSQKGIKDFNDYITKKKT
ncbi:MAG: NTP transferase domain-containing protein [Actinomycetia bacterium]|nr:NTP transferase domain-containing protein [Actinomycetes bacterium]